MNIIIQVYMFVCVMLLLFNICFLIVKNIKNHKYFPQKNRFRKEIQREIEFFRENSTFHPAFEAKLKKKLSVTKQLIILQNELQENSDNEALALAVRPYILGEIENYKTKTDYEQAFYTYVISTFDYAEHPIDQEFAHSFLSFLDTKSVYTFTNTMSAIYKFGEVNLAVLAVAHIDQREGFYHNKLFVDGYLSFSGNVQELSDELTARLGEYHAQTQVNILDFLRLKKMDISELCVDLLNNESIDQEVRYTAMRYFIRFPSEKTRLYFLDLLQKEDLFWAERMLTIQCLMGYSDTTVKEAITKRVTDRNWYVRSNAIKYLHNQHINRSDVFDILYLQDRYANESLLYQYRDDKEMMKYIVDTIQLLRIQQEDAFANEEFAIN